jgi:uroporphyrinogen decarboxylase
MEVKMHTKDAMTPLERKSALENGKPVDRYPVYPFVNVIAPKVAGMAQKEFRSSPRKMAEALAAAYRRFGQDSISVEYGLYSMGRSLGGGMSDPENALPALTDPVLKSLDDIDSLDFSKAEPERDGHMQKLLETAETLKRTVGQECAIGGALPGVLTVAAGIYKLDDLMRSMRKEPEKLHRLLRKCTDASKKLADAFNGAGLNISLADPIASGSVIKAPHYREFAKPYTAELVEHIHKNSKSVSYHICGQAINIVEDMVDTGADVLSVDNMTDMAKVKELVGDRIHIVGNVDPISVIMLGNRQEIWDAVKHCYETMHDSPCGYSLASGCDIPEAAPLENVDAFMDAARFYGKWPFTLKCAEV